jgi:5'-nucleotidase
MRILLSNDDGILAPGLAALYHAVKDLGEVTVVAPDSPRSAAGHSITIRRPLTVREVHVQGGDFRGLSVDGSPADCVRLAIFELLGEMPDLVLSGINAGANVGIHVFYSGTVAAAAEGSMFGVPAVALSAKVSEGEIDFEWAAEHCRAALEVILDKGLVRGDLVNVNVPSSGVGRPRGLKVVPQSTVELRDIYRKVHDRDGVQTYEIVDFSFLPGEAETDVAALDEGYMTVTPLHVNMTAVAKLPALRDLPWVTPGGEQ